MRKKKVSLTLSKEVVKGIDTEAYNLGLSRSATIEMNLRKRKRR